MNFWQKPEGKPPAVPNYPLEWGKKVKLDDAPEFLNLGDKAMWVLGHNECVSTLVEWVISCWRAEVENRPLVNIRRRPLDDTWRQVLRRLGEDDRRLLGPTHDELLEAQGKEKP